MKKRVLWKDINRCIVKSKGRFISIMCLVALGCFALVGLQASGPDMRETGKNYYQELNAADLTVLGDYGIDENDCAAIEKISGAEAIEYGYIKDVTIADELTSIRVFSETESVSLFELVEGKMPEEADELAIASYFSDQYAIGDMISFEEKENMFGKTVLVNHTFTVTGYVNSPELQSATNVGNSTAGTGELGGYAVVTAEAFDSDVYMIARLTFLDTDGVDPYSSEYTELVQAHKEELTELLADAPRLRLATVQAEYQQEIDEGQAEVDDVKAELADAESQLADSRAQLDDAAAQIADAKEELAQSVASAEVEIADGETQISEAKTQIEASQTQLDEAKNAIETGRMELSSAQEQLNTKKAEFSAAQAAIEQNEAELATQKEALADAGNVAVAAAESELAASKQQLSEAQTQITAAETQLAEKEQLLQSKEAEYAAGVSALESAKQELSAKETELAAAKNELAEKKQSGEAEIAEAEAELAAKETEYQDALAEYEEKRPDAETEIADAEEELLKAQETEDALTLPAYAVDTRREIPGSGGYRVYGSISRIVDDLADIFPVFFYLVAALVTLTTMTRFVDEERTNCGTLLALGYDTHDIVKKFTVYGSIASLTGAVGGIAAGHVVIPMIVYNAYKDTSTFPEIELHFYPGISVIALACSFVSAVIPAYVVAMRELRERPAALLLPKPPAAASSILLERVKFIWNRMNFTHKVTARNLFRYKKRMAMTIFGVCGAVTLLYTGFSVQHSISGINDRQFGEILNYDLIVARNEVDAEQTKEVDDLLASDAVEKQQPVFYETLYKVAGDNQDKQEIKLIVPQEADALSDYIALADRKTGEKITLSDDGAVITERLAKLLDVEIGDTITVSDAENVEYEMRVGAITEMYTGHFLFMDAVYYESVFGIAYDANANLVILKDGSIENANEQAAAFVKLDGVTGVVQNTTMINQINTIVSALDKIMDVLILVAMLLAVVILFNLTNINVSERIRELSTIKVLGFYDKEVTMYIYRETILLTAAGILAGFVTGNLLYRYILYDVPPDETMFNPALGAKAFLIPTAVIGVITLVLGFLVNRTLRDVDMMAALKSVE